MTELRSTYATAQPPKPYDIVLDSMKDVLKMLRETMPGASDSNTLRYSIIIGMMEQIIAYYEKFVCGL